MRASRKETAITALVRIRSALQRRWSGIMAQVIAVALFWGALVILWGALGLSGAWEGVPPPARRLDLLLIPFNVITGVALWQLRAWGVALLLGGAFLLQFVPYVLLRDLFVADPAMGVKINTLLVFELGALLLFAFLIIRGR